MISTLIDSSGKKVILSAILANVSSCIFSAINTSLNALKRFSKINLSKCSCVTSICSVNKSKKACLSLIKFGRKYRLIEGLLVTIGLSLSSKIIPLFASIRRILTKFLLAISSCVAPLIIWCEKSCATNIKKKAIIKRLYILFSFIGFLIMKIYLHFVYQQEQEYHYYG
jgi:hypothetical protein